LTYGNLGEKRKRREREKKIKWEERRGSGKKGQDK